MTMSFSIITCPKLFPSLAAQSESVINSDVMLTTVCVVREVKEVKDLQEISTFTISQFFGEVQRKEPSLQLLSHWKRENIKKLESIQFAELMRRNAFVSEMEIPGAGSFKLPESVARSEYSAMYGVYNSSRADTVAFAEVFSDNPSYDLLPFVFEPSRQTIEQNSPCFGEVTMVAEDKSLQDLLESEFYSSTKLSSKVEVECEMEYNIELGRNDELSSTSSVKKTVDTVILSNRKIAKIANVCVKDSVRGRGLGRQLIKLCERRASTWGFDCVFLQVDVVNNDARRFYRKLGYKEILLDSSLMGYDVAGFKLRMIKSPKYWMCKFI